MESNPEVCTSPSLQLQSPNQPSLPTEDITLFNPDQLMNVDEHTSLQTLVPIDAGNAECPSTSIAEKVQ